MAFIHSCHSLPVLFSLFLLFFPFYNRATVVLLNFVLRVSPAPALRHVAHQTALSAIKKAGKSRHARVDNATPRVLQFAHIRAEGMARRRRKEKEARRAEDPWIERRLRQAAQVGSSGVRPADAGGIEAPVLTPGRRTYHSAAWAAAADAAVRGGAHHAGRGIKHGDGTVTKREVKKTLRAASAGPTRAAPTSAGGGGAASRSKAAWDSSFSRPLSGKATGGNRHDAKPAAAAATSMRTKTRAKSAIPARPASGCLLLPGGGGACVDNLAARDLRAGGRVEELKAARRRMEAAAIAAENRRTYQRIVSAKPHYPKSDAVKHAAKHRTILEMHHEARGVPDMTSDLTKEPQPAFVSFGMGAYTLVDKKRGYGGGGGGAWHRTVGGGRQRSK